MIGRRAAWAPLTTLLAVLVLAGCRSTSSSTRLMAEAPNLKATKAELRITVRSLARPFGGQIEEAADAIAGSSDDPSVRRLALEWKIDAIPAMYEALFQRDPLAAVLDAAMLLEQMRDFFGATVAGRLDEAQRAIARGVVAEMREQLEALMVHAGSNPEGIAKGWTLIERWAAQDPVTGTFASRRTTAGRLAEFTARTGTGALAGVAGLGEELDDFSARIDVYAAHLPKQARWQAELLLLDSLGERGPVAATIRSLEPFSVEVDALPSSLESLPDDVAAMVAAERAQLQAWVRAERLDTQRFVQAERVAVLAAVAVEREHLMADVARERAVVLAGVSAEREAALAGLGDVVRGSMVEARSELIDHAALRLAQLLAAFGLVGFLAALVLIRVARAPRDRA